MFLFFLLGSVSYSYKDFCLDGFFIIMCCLVINESFVFLSGFFLMVLFLFYSLVLMGVFLGMCYMYGLSYLVFIEKGGFYLMCKVNEFFLEVVLYILYMCKFGIKIYDDLFNMWVLMCEDNKDKVGIYCWFNKVNGKFYMGSGDFLYVSLSDYY